jgi:hypothetical protein
MCSLIVDGWSTGEVVRALGAREINFWKYRVAAVDQPNQICTSDSRHLTID